MWTLIQSNLANSKSRGPDRKFELARFSNWRGFNFFMLKNQQKKFRKWLKRWKNHRILLKLKKNFEEASKNQKNSCMDGIWISDILHTILPQVSSKFFSTLIKFCDFFTFLNCYSVLRILLIDFSIFNKEKKIKLGIASVQRALKSTPFSANL